uniref:Transposase n=1 Tax=Steinernema glaseri TaxID=37863 RepID=A0A1I7YIS4_9BILA
MFSVHDIWIALHRCQKDPKQNSFRSRIARMVFGFLGTKRNHTDLPERRVRFKKRPLVHEISAFPWDEFPPFSHEEIQENREAVRMEGTLMAMEDDRIAPV